MASLRQIGLAILGGFLTLGAVAQPGRGGASSAATAANSPVSLEWTPPELAALGAMAEVKNSFVLDRTMLGAAAGLLPESEAGARQAVRKLDGMSVHYYKFREDGGMDPALVDAVRRAYHARGWKHLVTTTDKGGPLHDGKTDLWLALDGIDVRGGTLLLVTHRTLCLVTFAGDLSPVDLLHLRGHFGIPGFLGDTFEDAH